MMIEFGTSRLLVPSLLALSIGLIGCGGGSRNSSEPNNPSGGITVLPERFDFSLVTADNLDALPPQVFTLSNEGKTSYSISNMSLVGTDSASFLLDERAGTAPCQSRALPLSPGERCTVEVRFKPSNFNSFSSALAVESNDPNALLIARPLSGTYAEVKEINVEVNQINACSRPAMAAQAFVSVTDQGGFPVRGLLSGNFQLEEQGGPVFNPADARAVGTSGSNLAVSMVMDYSSSITDFGNARRNMEEAATVLVDAMSPNDEADVIKYADEIRFMLETLTSDRDLLKAAINEDPNFFRGTALYDATVDAIERLKLSDKDRRVIISLTDGSDSSSKNADLEGSIQDAVAADIPIFTVGFGNIVVAELQKMADDTGGLFYNPASSNNLNQVYQQLTNLLFDGQYLITFMSTVPEDVSASFVVKADFVKNGMVFKGEGNKIIQPCP